MTTEAGTSIVNPAEDWDLGEPGTVDPRDAAALALGQYLFNATFRRSGGAAADGEFRLKAVLHEWPEPDATLAYPSASIVDYTDGIIEGHDLVPTVIEESLDVFGPGTALVKTGELNQKFQVDFWADDLPTRTGIAANLPRLFAPGLTTSRLLLRASRRYYGRPIRVALVSLRRDDDAANVYVRERRITAIVSVQIDVVDLRCVRILLPSAEVDETTGPEANIDPAGCLAPADQEIRP